MIQTTNIVYSAFYISSFNTRVHKQIFNAFSKSKFNSRSCKKLFVKASPWTCCLHSLSLSLNLRETEAKSQWGVYSSAETYCMLFNNPHSHRTVESLVMTCSENGRDLFQANLDSLFNTKFLGLSTKEHFWQAWNQSLPIVWETTMNNQRWCGRVFKITEYWLNTGLFGHMEHYDRSNVAPTEWYNMSEHHMFLLQPFQYQQIGKPSYKTGYSRSAYSEVVLLCMMHTTLSINQQNKSPFRANKDTPLPGNSTTDRHTISHHDGYICSYHNNTPF